MLDPGSPKSMLAFQALQFEKILQSRTCSCGLQAQKKSKDAVGLKAQLPENRILEVPKNNGTSGVDKIFDRQRDEWYLLNSGSSKEQWYLRGRQDT